MINLEVVACKNSNSLEYIYGSSISKKTAITKIDLYDVNHPEELFAKALFFTDVDKYTIVLYDDLVSNFTPSQLLTYVEEILENKELDIFYLYKYCDSTLINKKVNSIMQVDIMKVYSPHGVEGLILTPKGKKILRNVIKQDNGRGYDFALNAYCPKIEAYSSNPTLLFTKEKSIKSIKSRDERIKSATPHCRNQNLGNLLWFIACMFVLIALVIILIKNIEDVENAEKTQNVQKIFYVN